MRSFWRVALVQQWGKSARGLAQSKTLPRGRAPHDSRQRLGLRRHSAAFVSRQTTATTSGARLPSPRRFTPPLFLQHLASVLFLTIAMSNISRGAGWEDRKSVV